jgi:hypothetical protein
LEEKGKKKGGRKSKSRGRSISNSKIEKNNNVPYVFVVHNKEK